MAVKTISLSSSYSLSLPMLGEGYVSKMSAMMVKPEICLSTKYSSSSSFPFKRSLHAEIVMTH